MPNLWTPWRLAYIVSDKEGPGCIFCDAVATSDDAASLVLRRGRHALVLINRYPYSNAHLMVAPRAHLGSLGEAASDVLAEVMDLARTCERILTETYRPQGFNLGMNLGRSAGAGVVGHLHLHLVPRWEGDTNYMAVVNDVRVIPERLEDTYRRLRPCFDSAGS